MREPKLKKKYWLVLVAVALCLLVTPLEAQTSQTHRVDTSQLNWGVANGETVSFSAASVDLGDGNGLWSWVDSDSIRFYNLKIGDSDAPTPWTVALSGANMTVLNLFESEQFVASFDGPSGSTSVTEIYVGSLGKPSQVTGTLSWEYDTANQIVTLRVMHTSPVTVTMAFSAPLVSGASGVNLLLQYLLVGDLIGFIVAVYTTRIGQGFYAIVLAIFFGALYNRTRSLMLCAILWLLLGGIFLILVPMVSVIAIVLITLGITGLLYKLHARD